MDFEVDAGPGPGAPGVGAGYGAIIRHEADFASDAVPGALRIVTTAFSRGTWCLYTPPLHQPFGEKLQCNKPIWMMANGMFVPCGKCRGCRMSRSREWAVRVLHEMESHEASSFVTLTYRDEELPDDESLDRAEFQKFIKRLRKVMAPLRLRYFACGEYGENTGRPHYHSILFGVPALKEIVATAWRKGHVDVGTVTYDSARYVADYVHKDNRPEMYEGREPPFGLKSQGLGREWALRNRGQLVRNVATSVRGVRMNLPRYYVDLLEIPPERRAAVAEERQAAMVELWERKHGPGWGEAWRSANQQRELELRALASRYKKGKL